MRAQSARRYFDHTLYLSAVPPTNLTRSRARCAIVVVEFDLKMLSLVEVRPDKD